MAQTTETGSMHAAQNVPGGDQPETRFSDGSGAIFSFYLEKAEKDDDEMAERWKGGADSILVFTGLFSATVAGFLAISLQSLSQNSQDTSAFYLAHLYQLSVAENGSASISLPPLSDPSSFSPSPSAIWVNMLWFLSLIVSLSCALLATLLQQWARRYLRLTRPAYVSHERAQVRSYPREVDSFDLTWLSDLLPGLLHLSVFLFYVGLLVFIARINISIFITTSSYVAGSVGYYLFISLDPLISDNLSHTPLSYVLSSCNDRSQRVLFNVLTFFYKPPPPPSWTQTFGSDYWDNKLTREGGLASFFIRWRRRLGHRSHGIVERVKRAALQQPCEIVSRAIQSFILTLAEDHEVERLVAGIPDFYRSEAIKEPSKILAGQDTTELGDLIIGFMARSSSDVMPEDVAMRRSALCIEAFEAGNFMLPRGTLTRYFPEHPTSYPRWINYGVLASMLAVNANDKHIAGEAQYITARLTASIGQSEERWFPVMLRQFGVTEDTLRQYTSRDDNLLLANLLYFVRRSVLDSSDSSVLPEPIGRIRLETVSAGKSISMEDALPELQKRFCEVWNDVVEFHRRQSGDSIESYNRRSTSREVLAFMRDLFVSLHPELTPPALSPRGSYRFADLSFGFPSCPDPTCHTARMQRPDTHDRQSHPSPDNPPSFVFDVTPPPPDEGTTDAHAAACSQTATSPDSSPSTSRETPATLSIGPASPGSGVSVVDASAPPHASGNPAEPPRSSSPIVSSMAQHVEAGVPPGP